MKSLLIPTASLQHYFHQQLPTCREHLRKRQCQGARSTVGEYLYLSTSGWCTPYLKGSSLEPSNKSVKNGRPHLLQQWKAAPSGLQASEAI